MVVTRSADQDKDVVRNGKDVSQTDIEDIINPGVDFAVADNEDRQLARRGGGGRDDGQLLPSKMFSSPLPMYPFHSQTDPSGGGGGGDIVRSQRRHVPHKARPAFVNKLWSMINDSSNAHLIQWSEDGNSFLVINRQEFVHEVLPRYFKHSNFASFVRQLNMYGWHKVQDVKSGSIQNSSDDKWQFANRNFIRGREDLLENIVRQKSRHSNNNNNINTNHNTKKGLPSVPGQLHITDESNSQTGNDGQFNVNALLGELEQLKYNQIAISKDLLRLSKDNEMLWKENMMARERHRNQQQALEKILRFLSALVPHADQRLITERVMGHDGKNDAIDLNNFNGSLDMNGMDMFNVDLDGVLNGMNNNTIPTTSMPNNNGMSGPTTTATTGNIISNNNNYAELNDARPRYLLENTKPEDIGRKNSSGRISEIPLNDTPGVTSEKDTTHLLDSLQSNIDAQDERIQQLEDMVSVMSPGSFEGILHRSPTPTTPGFDIQDYMNPPPPPPHSTTPSVNTSTPSSPSP